MSNTTRNDAIATNTVAADAFLALSKVYLVGIERLSALNLNTVREVVEDWATKSVSEARAGYDFQNLPSMLGQLMWEKAATYSRSAYEIMAKTNEEISKVFVGQLCQAHMASAVPAGWSAMLDMFAKGVQQITASAADNVAAVAERSKAVAATTMHPRKAA